MQYLAIIQMKTVLITGGSGGVGSFLAKRLAEEGYTIAVHYLTGKAEADKVVATIANNGGHAKAFAGKIDSQKGAAQLLQKVTTWSDGQLDILINCAGNYVGGTVAKLTEADWHAGLDSTVGAAFFTTQTALPWLRQAKGNGGGRIVNLGDSSCDRPTARDLALGYHIGKTGVLILTRSIAHAEAKHGITCNMVSPGYLENSVGLPPKKTIPAGRYGTFDDIWNAVEFLLKAESDYINGSNLVVSGGWNLR